MYLPKKAEGIYLDNIAQLYGIRRSKGESDKTLRQRVYERIMHRERSRECEEEYQEEDNAGVLSGSR